MEHSESGFSTYVVRLNGRVWGIALGMLFGTGLFLATIILVLKGGENVGQHLNLLSQYFPFYQVSWGGAFLGFIYAFFVGYAIGRSVCFFYNLAASPRRS
ncbi:MAG: hypothetical protein KDB53_13550 [Planctomycetes bacterium]|nr:hypothetical protein [Planctomycetota bacterium]